MLIIFSVAMLATGVICLVVVLRGGKGIMPSRGLEWMAAGTSALLVVASGALLAMVLARDVEEAEAWGRINVDAPDFAFTILDSGASASLSDYRGNVVLINFWATWCQPCITELPELDQLHADFEARGLVVLTLSDETREDLERFSDLLPKQAHSGYFELSELPPLYRAALREGRPVSYLVDRGGMLRNSLVGAGNYDSFKRLVRPYLAPSTEPQG